MSQQARLDNARSAAQSVQVELPGAFSPEHDQEVAAYVAGEITAAELYRRTVARYRQPYAAVAAHNGIVPDAADFEWDPFGTLHAALWIGGAQWAGKSTVANIVAVRHGLTAYHYDYHDARGHQDRRTARRARAGLARADPPAPVWAGSTPQELAEQCLAVFAERFEFVLDDLRALTSPNPVLAEGFGLRPDVLAPLLDSPGQMIVLTPTEEFRQHQLRTLPRAGALSAVVADPVRAQANRVERDRLLAADTVRAAREHGVRVLEVDGSVDAESIADAVAAHFGPYLPPRTR
jgi:hypothetical protein